MDCSVQEVFSEVLLEEGIEMNTQQMMEEINRLARLCEAKDAEIDRWKEAASDLGRCFDSSNKRISDIEQKLSEQTVFADKYAREVIEAKATIAMQAETLSAAKTGIKWWCAEYPDDTSGCDYEMCEQIDKALSATSETVAAWRAKETEPLRMEVAIQNRALMYVSNHVVFDNDGELQIIVADAINKTQATALAYEREVKARALESAYREICG